MKINLLYPGSVIIKRITHIFVVCLIGFNVLINNIQDLIMTKINSVSHEVSDAAMLVISKTEEKSWFGKFLSFLRSFFVTDKEVEHIKHLNDEVLFYIEKMLQFIHISSFFMCLPILYSIIWLCFDIKFGDSASFVKKALLFSIPFNFASYFILSYFIHSFIKVLF